MYESGFLMFKFSFFKSVLFGMYYPVSKVVEGLAFIFFFRNCRLLALEESGLVAGNLKS